MFGGAPDDKARHARAFGGELQTPRGRERHAAQFTNDTGKDAHAQAFLHRWQDLSVFPCFAENDAVRVKPDARKRRRKKIAAVQTPQDGSLQPREYSRREERGAGRIMAARAAVAEFMHSAEGETPAGQRFIYGLDTERQHLVARVRSPCGL